MFPKLRPTRFFMPRMVAVFFAVAGLFNVLSPVKILNIFQTRDSDDLWTFQEHFENTWNKTDPDGCPERVILLYDKGGLSDQIVEYIGTRVFSVYQEQNFFVQPELYQKFTQYFSNIGAIPMEKSRLNEICSIKDRDWTKISLDSFIHYALSDKSPSRFIQILGYSSDITTAEWEIMLENRDLILKEFQWKDDVKQVNQNQVQQLTRNRTYSKLVGLYVRRTDFSQHLSYFLGPLRKADRDFLIKAKNIYKEKYGNPLFMVISDNLEWCRANLAAKDVIFADLRGGETPDHELALLSSFDHLILSDWTYAITAVYFSGAEVIIADTSKQDLVILMND